MTAMDAFKARRARANGVLILSALERYGETYACHGYGGLPEHVGRWAMDPVRHALFQDSSVPVEDAKLHSAVTAAIREQFADAERLIAIIRNEELAIRCEPRVIIRHLATLLANAQGGMLALFAPPSDRVLLIEPNAWHQGSNLILGRFAGKTR